MSRRWIGVNCVNRVGEYFFHWALWIKMSDWLARYLPHSTISRIIFHIKLKIALQNNLSFCWLWKLSGKLVVTPLYLKSSMACFFSIFSFPSNNKLINKPMPKSDPILLLLFSRSTHLSISIFFYILTLCSSVCSKQTGPFPASIFLYFRLFNSWH